MKLTRYDNYKDSGVEWLREIPEFWKSYRFKDITLIQTSNVDKKTDENEEEVLLCNYIDVYKNDSINKSLNFMKATAKKDQISKFKLLKNDVIITKDSETAEDMAKPALVVEELKNIICGYHLALIRSKKYFVDNKFIFRLFQSSDFHWNFVVKSKGVTRVGLSINNAVNNQELFLPPISEQNEISNFLDKKTPQIDKKINLLQEKKGSYEELKKSLINETVCRGLNKDVELKDSGIEWIGKIPKYWKIERLKDQFSLISSGIYSFKEEKEYLSTKSISINKIEKIEETITFKKRPSRANMQPIINSVWFAKLRFTKKSYLFDDLEETKKYILSTGFAGLRTKSINSKFVNYYICSEYFLYQKDSTSYGTTQEAITEPNINQIIFICPPKKEQIQIANYLDEKTSKIDKIIFKINNQIETLKEFRKTLINDVVTGKVRIQDE